MSTVGAVQGRSGIPGRTGQLAKAEGGDDFSAVLAALGGSVAAAPVTPVAGHGDRPAGQGDPLRLVPAAVPGGLADTATDEASVVLQAPDADTPDLPLPLRPLAVATAPASAAGAAASLAEDPTPPPPAPVAAPPAAGVPTVPAACALPPAGTVPVDLPQGQPPVADVQVPFEAAASAPEDAPAVEPDAVFPDAAAQEQAPEEAPAPAAPAVVAGPADASPDLPPAASAATPAPSAGPVAAAAPPVEAAPAPPPPAAQLLTGLGPVLEGPDGAHTMSLQLHPEELGAVQVEISLRNGEISLALRTPDVGTLELLRSAAAELRTQLEATGLTSTGVSVDLGHGHESPAEQGRPGRSTRSGDGQPAGPDDEPATTLRTSDSALDVRI